MKKALYITLSATTVLAMGFLWSACCGTCSGCGGSDTEDWEKAMKSLESIEGTGGSTESTESTESSGGGSVCDQYEACCKAYADALSKVAGIPQSSIDAQKQACDSISTLKTTPGGDEACKTALDAMKQAGEAYKSMPGFEWPDACK